MNGLYAETSIKRKGTISSILLRVFSVSVVLIVIMFSGVIDNKALMMAGALLGAGVIWYWPRFSVEMEYVFCDGQLDFDMMIGGAKRKNILKIDFDSVEILAPKGSNALTSYQNLNIKDLSSHDKSVKPYVIIAKVGNEMVQIMFEPSQKMLEMMKNKSPRKIVMI